MTKFRTNPQTGKLETVDHDTSLSVAAQAATSAEALKRARQEVKDMIAGNTQFHVDPLAAPPVLEDADDGMDCCAVASGPGEFVPAEKLTTRGIIGVAMQRLGSDVGSAPIVFSDSIFLQRKQFYKVQVRFDQMRFDGGVIDYGNMVFKYTDPTAMEAALRAAFDRMRLQGDRDA